MTTAEQVAILDAELERATGDFDGMILDEREQQRREAAENAPPPQVASASGSSGGGYGEGEGSGGATTGGYGGAPGMPGNPMPGVTGGGGMPKNTAKYPPPADIPSGNDDDVVARQLREAAMREPDPKVREKLWDEYRKYKGIE